MNRAVTKRESEGGKSLLLKVLTAHYNSLVSARSDRTLLTHYSALLEYLKSSPNTYLPVRCDVERVQEEVPLLPGLAEPALETMSLDDLQMLVEDEGISRKQLERIAIERFSVPRGSMRSYSNRPRLVDKLRSLIDNERAHQIIGAVARGGATVSGQPGDRERVDPTHPNTGTRQDGS
jgi:hypothetical protein